MQPPRKLCPVCDTHLTGPQRCHLPNGFTHPMHDKCFDVMLKTMQNCPACKISRQEMLDRLTYEDKVRLDIEQNEEKLRELNKQYAALAENCDQLMTQSKARQKLQEQINKLKTILEYQKTSRPRLIPYNPWVLPEGSRKVVISGDTFSIFAQPFVIRPDAD